MPDCVMIKDFAIPDHWPRAYGLDVRWLTTAAIWGARDPESDVLYLYSEYFREAEPAVHAAAIRARGVWIPGLIDAQANNRSQVDGDRLIQMYWELGLKLQTIDNPLESGVVNLWQRMHSGRLKVFASLVDYLDERRLYRRDEKDQIVKEHDNLQDATRCLVNGICRLCTKPENPEIIPPARQVPWEYAWMGRADRSGGQNGPTGATTGILAVPPAQTGLP
jgi:hypothetical protein